MPALSWPLRVSILCWFAFEVGLLARDLANRKDRRGRDRGTRAIVSLTLVLSILIGWLLHRWAPALDTPAADAFAVVGVVVIWMGLAVRVWAVLTLAGSFSTFIQVDADQAVVTRGPYRWVRHPSYTGLLLIALGLGLSAGNWLSLAVCVAGTTLGLVPRITVEESELVRVLGERYRAYQRATRRLVPGLW
ncbi:methyltransferase family protein [Virgisporangium aurantiacum]|uniref:methyltransferase family protein n=1 Tax=Virgisporangium aurantiacum TaxID=175570 RepID=UPI00195260F2|nr:isoprenylcysteine carboxylmethyltransferase family protein [Virgisporangium aurantiacum]